MTTKVKLIAAGVITPSELTLTTASAGTNTVTPATTAFVQQELTSGLAPKATIASPTFTGTPAAATASGSTSTTQLATTAFVQQELTTLIGGAPSTLNDLNELAAAINDDANYNSTLTTALATKLPLAGGTMTGQLLVDTDTEHQIKIDASSASGASMHLNTAGGYAYTVYQNSDRIWRIGAYGGSSFTIRDQTGNANSLVIDSSSNSTFAGNITAPKFIMTGGSQIGQDYAYLKSNSTSNASLTLRKDSTGADSIDFLQLRSDGNGLVGKIEGDGDISFNNATFAAGASVGGKLLVSDGGNTTVAALQFGDAGTGISRPSTDQMNFLTADQTRMVILAGGNVGIGTTSPLTKLNIHEGAGGAAGVDFGLTLSSDRYQADYGVGIAFRPENNSTSYKTKTAILASGGGYGYNQADLHFCIDSDNTITNEVGLADSVMTLKKGGNVGIGTTAPSELLEVRKDSGNATIKVQTGGGNDAILILDAPGASGAESQIRFDDSGTTAGSIIYAHNSGGTDFMTFGTGGSNTERMRILSDGSIKHFSGAGTLHLQGLGGSSNLIEGNGSLKIKAAGGSVDLLNGSLESLNTTAQGITVNGPNSADLTINAPTDNASLSIKAGTSDTGAEEAVVTFYQNTSPKWQLGNITTNEFRLYNYAASSAAILVAASGVVTVAGKIVVNTTDSQFYNRLLVKNGTHGLYMGQWDGANHRIEGDANRPVTIQSYHAGGITLGISGNPKLVATGAGVAVTGTISSTSTANVHELNTSQGLYDIVSVNPAGFAAGAAANTWHEITDVNWNGYGTSDNVHDHFCIALFWTSGVAANGYNHRIRIYVPNFSSNVNNPYRPTPANGSFSSTHRNYDSSPSALIFASHHTGSSGGFKFDARFTNQSTATGNLPLRLQVKTNTPPASGTSVTMKVWRL